MAKSTEETFINAVIEDYKTCRLSREISLMSRREVLNGRAKFGITGAGKEVPQVAMARAFKKGDFRSGYYRDQTFMLALGLASIQDLFAQLYADTQNDPFSGGRQMNCHFATPYIDKDGNWVKQSEKFNVTSDISSTAGQMARGLGVALASKVYRNNEALDSDTNFSNKGNEVCFCTIGDASTSEGVFWETVNAAAVMKVPLAISVWDDGYGISVPIKYQTTKQSISKALDGFRLDENGDGIMIYTAKGWDYQGLCNIYSEGIESVRKLHIPALFHIQEVTQPQGHSTSGSHERYKSKERLQLEKDIDGIDIMRAWMIDNGIFTQEEADEIDSYSKNHTREERDKAWKNFNDPIKKHIRDVLSIYDKLIASNTQTDQIQKIKQELQNAFNPTNFDASISIKKTLRLLGSSPNAAKDELIELLQKRTKQAKIDFGTHLHINNSKSALQVPEVKVAYDENAPIKNAYQILNAFFDSALERHSNLLAFGEDVGKIGDVNQGLAGLQEKHGENRVFDTGIREWTIIGQAIGMAMRGLRPIAEIQYLDYLLYGLVPLSDDLATLHYRSDGIQIAPAIIRTRGHRLEGIWHTGSPLGMMINSLRGIYLLVPRNMTQAAGMYNTMLQSNDPAIIIECLNAYRLKEKMPSNLDTFTVPLGVPEVLQEGTDITLVTYGSCVRVAQKGIKYLEEHGVSVELIDVQTLLPFDLEHRISDSLKKTNRVLFLDEDVPGGATAYMLQNVIEEQHSYQYLDSEPRTLSAKSHRTPYGSDGDYYAKPSADDVFESVYSIMHEADPSRFPKLWF